MVPVFGAQAVEAAVPPERALDAVRDAFVAYARGEWSMPPTFAQCRRSEPATPR
jgi:hypothetical protein